jgi:PrtD family type I secretion system ABC transporter
MSITVPGLTPKVALRALTRVLAIVFGFSFFVNALTMAVPLFTMQLFDRVLSSRSTDTLWLLAAIAFFVIGCYGVLEGLRSRVMAGISNWLFDTLQPELMRTQLDRAAEGRGAGRVNGLSHLRNLASLFSGQALLSVFDTLWSPLFFLVAFLIHPMLGLIGLIGAVGMMALAASSEILVRGPQRLANMVTQGANNTADGALRCAEVVSALGMAPAVLGRISGETDQARRHLDYVQNRTTAIASLTKTFRYLIQIAVLCTGIWLVLGSEITGGAVFAAAMILARGLSPFEQMQRSWTTIVTARQSYQHLTDFLQEPTLQRSSVAYPQPKGRLQAEDVSFSMPGQARLILQSVSFSLEPGEALGIVGPSAAGKSTLARLLIGIWRPHRGRVRLDGVDVSLWDRADFGRYVGYVPQDVELLSGTIRDNIARFSDAEDAEVIAAAKAANAHDLIARLPQGYDTEVGEGGALLSGGQRQRIALARALFRDPTFIVLDEPNSNLDAEGEAAMLDALGNARRRGATIIMIAHRPSLLAFVDKLLVLKAGRIDAFGERQDVLAKVQPRPTVVPRKPAGPLGSENTKLIIERASS